MTYPDGNRQFLLGNVFHRPPHLDMIVSFYLFIICFLFGGIAFVFCFFLQDQVGYEIC